MTLAPLLLTAGLCLGLSVAMFVVREWMLGRTRRSVRNPLAGHPSAPHGA